MTLDDLPNYRFFHCKPTICGTPMMEPLPSRRADLDTPDTRELRKLIEEVGHKLKDPRRQAPRSSCSWGSPEVDGK